MLRIRQYKDVYLDQCIPSVFYNNKNLHSPVGLGIHWPRYTSLRSRHIGGRHPRCVGAAHRATRDYVVTRTRKLEVYKPSKSRGLQMVTGLEKANRKRGTHKRLHFSSLLLIFCAPTCFKHSQTVIARNVANRLPKSDRTHNILPKGYVKVTEPFVTF